MYKTLKQYMSDIIIKRDNSLVIVTKPNTYVEHYCSSNSRTGYVIHKKDTNTDLRIAQFIIEYMLHL